MRKSGHWNRRQVSASIPEDVFLTLEMLGFDKRKLIEELLCNVAAKKLCPCCGREVRPLITGRNAKAYKTQKTENDQD